MIIFNFDGDDVLSLILAIIIGPAILIWLGGCLFGC